VFSITILAVLLGVCHSQLVNDAKSVNPVGCGRRLNDFPNKIVGGYPAQTGDWGWQIGLNYNGRHTCGGSLINSEWIITAAHCLYGRTNPSYYTVNLGYNDRLSPNAWSIVRPVSKLFNHELYSPTTFSNDIALMKLAQPVTYSKYIVPACIPTVANVDYAGQDSWSTGWGTTSSGGSLSRYLLEVVLPVLTDDRCYQKYRVPDKRTGFCAGETGANKDTCQGDSGGPLVVVDQNGPDRGNWTVAGLTSYGRGCGDGGVVSRVSNYYNWIVNKIANN